MSDPPLALPAHTPPCSDQCKRPHPLSLTGDGCDLQLQARSVAMNETVTWEDPPPGGGRSQTTWADRIAPLRDRPGEWANLGEHATSAQHGLKRGRLGGAEPGEFEVVLRNTKNGRATIYARYIGGDA